MVWALAASCLVMTRGGACAQTPDPPVAQPVGATVYWAHHDGAVEGFLAMPTATRRMVDALVRAVTGAATTREAWASLVKPGQRVGIKVDTAAGPLFTTRPPVVLAVIEGLKSAGIAGRDIVVWDRDSKSLARAGFTAGALGCRVAGVDGRWLAEPVYFSPRLGKLIWGDREFRGGRWAGLGDADAESLSNKSHFAEVLEEVDVLIHLPALSDSAFTGLRGAIAGVALDSVDNWRRFGAPPAHGADDLPQIYAGELLGPRIVLTIMDALVAQFAGGPWFDPNYTVRHASLYASTDPVALDAVALAEIEGWRAEARLPPAAPRAGHIRVAASIGLGVADPARIRMVQVTP